MTRHFNIGGPCNAAKNCVLAIAIAAGAFLQARAFSVHDGLLFDLGFLNPQETAVRPSTDDIVDLTTWSASTRLTASSVPTFVGGGTPVTETPTPVSIRNVTARDSFYGWQQKTRTVIQFPLNTNCTDGVTRIFPQVVKFDRPIYSGSNVTIYVRFIIDSNVPLPASYNPSYTHTLFSNRQTVNGKQVGWGFMYQVDARTTVANTGYMRMFFGNKEQLDYGFSIGLRVWYSMAVTLAMSEDGQTINLTYYMASTSSDGKMSVSVTSRQWTYTDFTNLAVPAGTKGACYFGGASSLVGKTDWVTADNTYTQSFCGRVAEFRVYDRCMTRAEVMAHLAGADAAAFATGAANGSADEFAAADDADVAETFEPKAMPARRMRKSLTAEHPSLTVKLPVPPEEAGLVKLLRMKPILTDVGASAPYSVAVNGVGVGTGDFAKTDGGDFCIRRKRWTRDADGNATVTVTRTGNLAGTVSFDALTLTGSWQGGKRSGDTFTSTALTNFQNVVKSDSADRAWTPIGATPNEPYLFTSTIYGRSSSGSTYYPETTVCFDVPEYAARLGGASFEFATGGYWHPGSSTQARVYLNGTEVAYYPSLSDTSPHLITFGPGVLTPGINRIRILNDSPQRSAEVVSDYSSFNILYERFIVPPKPNGTVIFLR